MNVLLPLASILVLTSAAPVINLADGTTISKDESNKDFLFLTKDLPRHTNGSINFRLMPEVGNGHIGHVPFSDTVYMSALYNGQGGNSHRARIPAYCAFEMDFSDFRLNDGDIVNQYSLNVQKGFFEMVSTIRSRYLNISQKVYAHAHEQFPHLLVYELKIWRMEGGQANSDIDFRIRSLDGSVSEDLKLQLDSKYLAGVHRFGTTTEAENPDNKLQEIHIYHSKIRPYMTFRASDPNPLTVSYVMSVAHSEEEAKRFYESSLVHTSTAYLLDQHSVTWTKMWDTGRVDVGGNLTLSKMAYASLYYLLSSLPLKDDGVGGISAGGLAHGGSGKDYQGHVTWEQDAWIFPVALLLFQEKAKDLLQYRMDRLQMAKYLAGNMSLGGARYPFESAYTGMDVTPGACELCKAAPCEICKKINQYTEHVTAEVALAVRQYVLATRDLAWLAKEGGFDFYKSLATYLGDRATYDSRKKTYNINNVVGPDIYQTNKELLIVNNSLYTNVATSITMASAEYIWCLAGKAGVELIPTQWKTYLARVALPRSGTLLLPFDDYKANSTKDKLLFPSPLAIGYPLDFVIGPHARRTIIEHYSTTIADDAPAYTWATLATGWAEVGELEKAKDAFHKTFDGFTRQPFWIWTDTNDKSKVGRINHLTAMTSFLQTLLFGFGGIRMYSDRLAFNPRCPTPEASYMSFSGIDYMGYSFDLTFDEQTVDLTVKKMHPRRLVQLKVGDGKELKNFTMGKSIHFPRQPFSFHLLAEDKCGLPNVSPADNAVEPTANEQVLGVGAAQRNLPTLLSIFITIFLTVKLTYVL
ncbi:protein-glucosylgalactosylhydroxylysine glucosidase-like [Lineus longissimus]|uniref:protein-glucosylgalactosylhydroxylysine glucosidase-like n=1 Tax=Lineus longissimus TaxID=88925 RepID=UPI002B4CEC0F